MEKVIAGLYLIEQKIGSGGGGVVYLGTHLRLNKRIVLKADKRSLNTRQDLLRREVDMLKGLSHTYIPQVYDFVQEDGIVYTVMEYIDGESLDHILERGQTPPQAQMIQWACQLLEALVYLHSRPPHGILHADIKPANIMLRPNGDICLIDYNIALALGEDGAVKVGYSRGYASPEHYGSDGGIGSTISEHQGKKLDARSDIYSLGATLYHLISGVRPALKAEEVVPLPEEICSRAVSTIIQKAMAPDPEQRFQTAEEMLKAFRALPVKDPRMVRHKRRLKTSVGLCVLLFLASGGITFMGLKQMEQRQTALKLAEYSADERGRGNITGAVELALQAIPSGNHLTDAPVTAEAQKALTDALGVYDLSDTFVSLDMAALPSAPFDVVWSPEQTYFAAVCEGTLIVFNTKDQLQIAEFPVADSALAEAVFLDEHKILYAGKDGVTLYDLEQEKEIWKGAEATGLALSGDGTIAAAVNRNDTKAVLYRTEDGSVLTECSFNGKSRQTAYNDIFANPKDSIFELNQDGSMLAVSFSDGTLTLFDLQNEADNLYMYDESNYSRFQGGFSGNYFAFVAGKEDQSVFGLIDTAEGTYAGEIQSRNQMHAKTNDRGIWLSEGNLLVCFDPVTLEDTEMAFTDKLNIEDFAVGKEYTLTVTDDSGFSVFDQSANQIVYETTEEPVDFCLLSDQYAIVANRSQPQIRLLENKNHKDADVFLYDARYAHDEARISQDQKTTMLFNYQGFRIYDPSGNLVAEEKLPESEKIYDQQFRRENADSWLEVIWYDGTVRNYSAADGSLISEEKREAPSKDLAETFETEQYQFISELHQAPKVLDRKSGKEIRTLEDDDYLTYVTEVDDHIITEYVTAEGKRYGLLLNQNLETVAILPDLCDIIDQTCIFDYGNGELRQCRFYSLQDLINLGEQYIKGEKGDER